MIAPEHLVPAVLVGLLVALVLAALVGMTVGARGRKASVAVWLLVLAVAAALWFGLPLLMGSP